MRCKDKEDFILANYKTMSYKEMGKILGIGNSTIQYYLKKNGLRKMERELTEEELAFIKENYKSMTYKEIAEKFGVSERHIRGRINYMKMPKTRRFNNDYFHIIDSDIKAYFLGFIFADGWVCSNPQNRTYEFGMQIQSEDKYILDKLNEELGGIHLITHNEPYTSEIKGVVAHHKASDTLRVFSKQIVDDLITHGIEQNKTQKDKYPIVDKDLFFDFLRGYIDGDGCYYMNARNKPYMHITCSSIEPLKWIQKKLLEYDIRTSLYMENERKYRLHCINNGSMIKLISLIYHPNFSICLSRKLEIVKSYLDGSAM